MDSAGANTCLDTNFINLGYVFLNVLLIPFIYRYLSLKLSQFGALIPGSF